MNLSVMYPRESFLPVKYWNGLKHWLRVSKTGVFTKLPATLLYLLFVLAPSIPLVVYSFVIGFLSQLVGKNFLITIILIPFAALGTLVMYGMNSAYFALTKIMFNGPNEEYIQEMVLSCLPPEMFASQQEADNVRASVKQQLDEQIKKLPKE